MRCSAPQIEAKEIETANIDQCSIDSEYFRNSPVALDENIKYEIQSNGSFSASFTEPSMLLIANHPHNKSIRPSPRRFYPFRGVSTQTSK
jgi:hypothetical protein